MRLYPACDVRWPMAPDESHVERLLAEIDEDKPIAVEEIDGGRRIFFQTAEMRTRAAARLIALDAQADVTPCEISDEDWAARSQAQIVAVHVGALTVAPPWDVPANRDGVLVINPGMGFGTGHHQSTRLCLALLQQQHVTSTRVLDVGTGSGVLAIGAWKLGASDVVAVDVDEDALLSARENIALNGASDVVVLRAVDLADHAPLESSAAFAIVLANLTGGLLIRHASQLAAWVAPSGALIVSGLTADEERPVVSAFEHAGLTMHDRAGEGEWVGLAFTSPSAPTTR